MIIQNTLYKHFVINWYFIRCNLIHVTKTSEGNSYYDETQNKLTTENNSNYEETQTNNCKNNLYQTVDVKKRNINVTIINNFSYVYTNFNYFMHFCTCNRY